MTMRLTVPLGVIVVREANSHSWEEFRWRTVGISLDTLDKADWRGRAREGSRSGYHAATVPLTLQSKETISYRVNLANGEPCLYVVLRQDPLAPAEQPISVRCVTASPFEAQAHTDISLDWVDRVPMPARLVSIVEGFVARECLDDEEATDGHAVTCEPGVVAFDQETLLVVQEHDPITFQPRR